MDDTPQHYLHRRSVFGHDEWFFDTELLLSAERRGNRIIEVPVADENVEVVRIEVR